MALEKSANSAPSDDAALRSAIVNVARHFLHLAERKSPSEMEAIIWRHASVDGADHGPSCAAFASLTVELGSHVAGHESWVTGGTSYPWPLHAWADARVDRNPESPNVWSVLRMPRATTAGTRSAMAISLSPAIGFCSMVMWRSSPTTTEACCTRSAATRCRIIR